MVQSGTTTATSQAAAGSNGLTIAQILSRLNDAVGGTQSAGRDTTLYQCITAAGQAAATWGGTDWWWLHDTGSFPTVADTANYNLRTVNSNDMSDLKAVTKAYYDDDWPLRPMTWQEYRNWYVIVRPNATTTKPLGYSVVGEPPIMWVYPVPDAAYTIYVNYIKRHARISSGAQDAALLVPAEYQEGIYIGGATWLMRHEITNSASLAECPPFMEAIGRMYENKPGRADVDPQDLFQDARGTLPHDRRILPHEGGYQIMNDVSV